MVKIPELGKSYEWKLCGANWKSFNPLHTPSRYAIDLDSICKAPGCNLLK